MEGHGIFDGFGSQLSTFLKDHKLTGITGNNIYARLKHAAQAHANRYSTGRNLGSSVVVLVNPYLHRIISLDEKQAKAAEHMSSNIEELVKNLDRTAYELVLVDDVISYIRETHSLVEKFGLDFFVPHTENGQTFNSKKFVMFNSAVHNVYIAGMFGEVDIKRVSDVIHSRVSSAKILKVNDSVLYQDPSIIHVLQSKFGHTKHDIFYQKSANTQ